MTITTEVVAFDRRGREIGHGDGTGPPQALPPHSRGMCLAEIGVPTGRHVGRVSVEVGRYARTTWRPYPLTLRVQPPVRGSDGVTVLSDAVRNDGPSELRHALIDVAAWGPNGKIRDFTQIDARPSRVAPGHWAQFTTTTLRAAASDRFVYWTSVAYAEG